MIDCCNILVFYILPRLRIVFESIQDKNHYFFHISVHKKTKKKTVLIFFLIVSSFMYSQMFLVTINLYENIQDYGIMILNLLCYQSPHNFCIFSFKYISNRQFFLIIKMLTNIYIGFKFRDRRVSVKKVD